MTHDRRAMVIARLKANALIPAGIPVRIVPIGPGSRSGGWKWRAEDASTGADLAVGSRHPVSDLFDVPRWDITIEPQGLHIGMDRG